MNKLVHSYRDLEIFLTLVSPQEPKKLWDTDQGAGMKVCVQVLLQLPSDTLFSHPLRCVAVITWTWHRILFRMAIPILLLPSPLHVQHTQSSSGGC